MQHPPKKQLKKKPGRKVLLPVLVLCLMAAVAFVLAVPALQRKQASQSMQAVIKPSAVRTLDMRDAKDIDTAWIQPEGAESYTLAFRDGVPYLLEDRWIDISDAYADDLTEALTQIVAQETVTQNADEVRDHLADMGLNPPRASASILYKDGTTATIEIGAPVPNTTYAYYRWSGDAGIYMCDVGIRETFALTRKHLLQVDQPVIHAVLVEEMTVTNAYGTSTFAFENAASGQLTAPYAYPLSDAAVDSLLSAAANFRLGTVEDALREDNRAAYGLDDPLCTVDIRCRAGDVNAVDENGALTVQEIPAQHLRFVIGREEDAFFYTCAYADQCYLVSRFLAETLVELNPADHITRTPAAPGNEALAAVRVEAPQATWELQARRVERVLPNNQLETDPNGLPVYDTLVTINGAEAPAETLDEWTQRLQNWTVAGDLPEGFALAQNAQPRWRIEWVSESGKTRSVTGYRMDAFSDAVAVDGVLKHSIHTDAITALTAGWQHPHPAQPSPASEAADRQ